MSQSYILSGRNPNIAQYIKEKRGLLCHALQFDGRRNNHYHKKGDTNAVHAIRVEAAMLSSCDKWVESFLRFQTTRMSITLLYPQCRQTASSGPRCKCTNLFSIIQGFRGFFTQTYFRNWTHNHATLSGIKELPVGGMKKFLFEAHFCICLMTKLRTPAGFLHGLTHKVGSPTRLASSTLFAEIQTGL